MNRRTFFKALGLLSSAVALPKSEAAKIIPPVAMSAANEYAQAVNGLTDSLVYRCAAADLDREELENMARSMGILE